jgi:MFS family permease
MLLWANVASRYGLLKAMASALCIYAFYAVLMAFASAPWHLFAIAVLNSAGAAAVLSLPVSAFQELFNDRPGLGTSLVPVMSFIGSVLSSAGFALGTVLSDYSGSAFVISAMCLMGVACLVLLERWSKP